MVVLSTTGMALASQFWRAREHRALDMADTSGDLLQAASISRDTPLG
jgi:hypothetical protein